MKKSVLFISLISLISLAAPVAIYAADAVWIKGYKYYPLDVICQQKGIEYSWDAAGRTAVLRKNGVEARIIAGSDKLFVNGRDFKDIGPPVYFYEETVIAPTTFTDKTIDKIFGVGPGRAPSLTPAPEAAAAVKTKPPPSREPSYAIDTIALDAGHGGNDPGAISRYYRLQEKNVNLDIAKRVKRLLSPYGITAHLTRDRDRFVSLDKRAEFACRKKADFFVSIHTNSSRSKSLRGLEVYYLSEKANDSERARGAAENSLLNLKGGSIDRQNATARAIVYDLKFTENRVESREMAKILLRAARQKNIYTRKSSLKSARFHVLQNIKTDMPAVLVEIGYMSNNTEGEKIADAAYREKLAQAITEGILEYKREYETKNGFCR